MQEEIILKNFSERLSELVKNSDIDIQRLAEMIGIKSKSTIYRYMNAEMAPKIPTVKCLSEIFNVNPVWLMGYDVPKLQETKNNELKKNKISVLGSIPAGIPLELIEDIIDYEEISEEMLKGDKEYFGLKVSGNSMEPKYLNGDTLIIQKLSDCESGQDCIVMVNGDDGTFKRVIKNRDGIILQPLNPNYEIKFYTNKQIEDLPIRILGVVREIRRTV